MRLTNIMLASVSAVIALPAMAQVTTPAEPAEAATSEQNIADIVVTATRRSERLSNIPIAVSAVNSDALRSSGANDIRGLNQVAPSLLLSSASSEANASARIRGIGTLGENPGLESSVAVFIDGVYRSRTGSGLNDIGEIDRVEVLRGPQGTLSGRNASAGVISIFTKLPSYDFGGTAEATYGNYDAIRLVGGITGPIVADKVAFRVDGVFNKRDGYLKDVANDTDYNDRNRYFLRGQLLIEPSDTLRLRLIADYTHRDEKCCGAIVSDAREKLDPTPGVPGDYSINPAGNRIVQVMQSLGAIFPSGDDVYNRKMVNSPGRAYSNKTKDWGGSAQVDWDLDWASLTSITGYRYYKAFGAADIDFSNVDIALRAGDGNNFRRFKTFTQEVRLNGSALSDKLDWLIGGYYSHEDLKNADNIQFGSQYGAFASCRVVATINPLAALRNPAAAGCLSPAGTAALTGALGPAAPLIISGLNNLSTINSLGSVRDEFNQTSESYALFTHNIFKVTDRLSLTVGARYAHEHKSLGATFNNNNTVCPVQQSALAPLLSNAALANLAGAIITLSCTGNSTSALNSKVLSDGFSEKKLTGTAVVSYKPTNGTLVYASYSRGYKAGGYNLDKSDLGSAVLASTTANPVTSKLRFDPETVDAFEIGLKYTSRAFTLNAAAFRQQFSNFQLNTFNGTNFVVQNIGSCSQSLNGADQDLSPTTGACSAKVKYGVLSQGVELEAGLYPIKELGFRLGYTYADTHYKHDLVGSKAGEPLDPALFALAGGALTSAPKNTVTASVTWTPEIGSSGLTALFYADTRMTSDFNTGSDLFPEKEQDGFATVNARVGIRGPNDRWSVELWSQNLLNAKYTQTTINAPFQGSGSIAQVKAFGSPSFAVGNQVFAAYLGEPRTYGLTVRTRF